MAIKNKKLKKEVEKLADDESRIHARQLVYDTIFAIAAHISDQADVDYPHWAKDRRRRKALEYQAYILSEIMRLLDGFKVEYFSPDDKLYGGLYRFSPEKFWEEVDNGNEIRNGLVEKQNDNRGDSDNPSNRRNLPSA